MVMSVLHSVIWTCVSEMFVFKASFTLFLPTEVFICGGYNGELILSDLWKINLQTFQWIKLPAVMPEPAYFHCAAVTPVSHSHVSVSQLVRRFVFCTGPDAHGAT